MFCLVVVCAEVWCVCLGGEVEGCVCSDVSGCSGGGVSVVDSWIVGVGGCVIGDGLWCISKLWAVSGSGALGICLVIEGGFGLMSGICWWEMEGERGR